MYSKAQSGVGKDIGNLPFLRRMLGLAVLVIFVLQGYAVQTHVHGLSSIGTTGVRLPTASSIFERVHAQLPGDRDPADCPLCQADILGGSFITPTVLTVLPILSFVEISPIPAFVRVDVYRHFYGWQSRVPPIR